MENIINKIEKQEVVTMKFNHAELYKVYVTEFMKTKKDYNDGTVNRNVAIAVIARILGAYSAHTLEAAKNGMDKETFEKAETTIEIMEKELTAIVTGIK